jgi:hypothetical protein
MDQNQALDEFPRVDLDSHGPEEVAGVGQGGYVGGIAQMRIYKMAWTETMIKDYHEQATANGVQLKECKSLSEFGDNPVWADSFGHGCIWFATAVLKYPLTRPCEQIEASQNCPVACQTATPCFEGLNPVNIPVWNLESSKKRIQNLGL